LKTALIAVALIVAAVAGFVLFPGAEPHIVIPGDELWTVGPLKITSTLLGSWLAMLVLIGGAFLLTRGMSLIPKGGQNFIEGFLEFLLSQMEAIAGRDKARVFFPVIATFFLFILIGNWLALLPFYKSVGITKDYGHEIFADIAHYGAEDHPISEDHHYFAWEMEKVGGIGVAPNGGGTFKFDTHEGEDPGEALDRYVVALAEFFTDYEVEGDAEHPSAAEVQAAYAALEADPDAPRFLTGEGEGEGHDAVTSPALGQTFTGIDFPGTKVAMVYPFFRAAFSDLSNTIALALVGFFMIEFWGFKFLGIGYLSKFFVNPLKKPILSFVGFLELISEFIRIISFAFRLFGNIFAGGVLLLILTFLVPFIAPIGIYGLELFVGLIQAIVFSLLVLVFASMATQKHGDHDEEHGHGHGEGHGEGGHTTGAVQAH